MRTNPDFILRKIAGECMLVPSGAAAKNINGLISLNEVAEFIWSNINSCATIEELVEKVWDEFEVDKERAESDTKIFVREMIRAGMILAE